MSKELDYFDKQIILYCKNWFKKTNLIDDLKVFVSKWAGIKAEDVGIFNVYQKLLEIFFVVYPQKAEYFLSEIFRYKNQITINDMIEKLCCELSYNLKVFNSKTNTVIIDLGEPDYSILPVKENGYE